MIRRFVVYAIAAAVAALLVATISQERLVAYDSRATVVVFALVLGLLNATIVPVLKVLTLPLSCLTFGLFALLLNAAAFGAAASLAGGMRVTLLGAIAGAVVTSVASGAIYSLVDEP